MKVVSDILGHRRPSSTSVYVRVALRRLRDNTSGAEMKAKFHSLLSNDLKQFLLFKRGLGYRYTRAEFTLLEFDRFVQEYAARHKEWRLDQAMVAWLASKPKRKAVSVSMDAAVLRQFCSYLRRRPNCPLVHEPLWPQYPPIHVYALCALGRQREAIAPTCNKIIPPPVQGYSIPGTPLTSVLHRPSLRRGPPASP